MFLREGPQVGRAVSERVVTVGCSGEEEAGVVVTIYATVPLERLCTPNIE